ncbi:MAG: hypothetical protein WCF67_02805 [Chitinophagaceae bacterium]
MRKALLAIFAFAIMSGLKAQPSDSANFSVISDAVKLKSFIKNGKFDPQQITAVNAILSHHVDFDNGETINTEFQDNPFIKTYMAREHPQAGALGVTLGNVFRRVGNTDVTTVADGLAKFLVERTKEELAVAFFVQLKEDFQDPRYQDLRLLFSQTAITLDLIDTKIYQFSTYLTDLRNAFILDLKSLTKTLPIVLELPKYQQYFQTRPKLRNILQISLFLGNAIITQKQVNHIGLVIEDLAPDLYFDTAIAGNKNINGAIKTLQLFSAAFRSTDTSGSSGDSARYWTIRDTALMLARDTSVFRIFMGLIHARANEIVFQNNVTLQDILTRVAAKPSFLEVQTSLTKFFVQLDLFESYKNTIKEIKSGQSKDSLYLFQHGLYSASLEILETGLTLTHEWIPGFNPDVDKIGSILKDIGNIYLYVNEERYALAISSVTSLYTSIFPDSTKNKRFVKYLGKLNLYATFISEVANAENSDEVKNIIARTVLPTGSSYIKKQSRFNIALQAYTGLFAGQERLRTDTAFVGVGGVYAPVGISLSKSFKPSFSKSRWSGTLFISLIDIGSLVSYRFSNYNDTLASDVSIRLNQIVSPGFYGIIGLPKLPVSFGGGVNWSPLLSTVEKESITTKPTGSRPFRWQVFIAVDIPLLNFHNKPR